MATPLRGRFRTLCSTTATTTTLWPALATAAEARKQGRSPATDRLFGPGTALANRVQLTSTARARTTLRWPHARPPAATQPGVLARPARRDPWAVPRISHARSRGVHPL
ncbi:hypothetical protein MRX96_050610 [Rhipicephalus microplus]